MAARTHALVAQARQAKKPVHAGLELTKLVPWKRGQRGAPETSKEEAFRNVRAALGTDGAKQLARSWLERRRAWVAALGDRARSIQVETVSPCLLWLAAPTALELGFCIHHTYGLPYLPGSGLKGLACAWTLAELPDRTEEPPDKIRVLFGEGGDSGQIGHVVFLDGIPIDPDCLEAEVMSPHHPNYYKGKSKIPHDCEDPIPLSFLRIAVGSRFELALLAGPRGEKEDLDWAEKFLRSGLQELGFGAKTSSGYGLFDEPGAAGDQGKRPETGGPRARGSARPAAAETAIVAVAEAWDHGEVVFRTDDGAEIRLDAVMLESKFGVNRRGWRDRCRQGQRYRIVRSNSRVTEFAREQG